MSSTYDEVTDREQRMLDLMHAAALAVDAEEALGEIRRECRVDEDPALWEALLGAERRDRAEARRQLPVVLHPYRRDDDGERHGSHVPLEALNLPPAYAPSRGTGADDLLPPPPAPDLDLLGDDDYPDVNPVRPSDDELDAMGLTPAEWFEQHDPSA